MQEYSSMEQSHKTLTVIIVTIAHTAFLLLIFFVLIQELQDSRHLEDFAKILSQSPHEQAQVLFLNEPGTGAQLEDQKQYTQPGLAHEVQEIDSASQSSEDEKIIDDTKTGSEQLEVIESAIPERMQAALASAEQEQLVAVKKKKRKKVEGTIGDVTMGQIAQGFLKSLQQQAGHNPGTTIDAEQLARQRYGTRVWTLLSNSYRATKMPTHLLGDITTQAIIVLTIKKDGTLLNIEMQHPNKSHDLREIESIILKAAKTAGLFPPIPNQFNVDTITLSFPLGIKGHQGVHVYDFMYSS